ncbi:MAG: GNAT family N-acetyltransferase [Clostridiales bacterium]|nr:GNAT family N-acetyltransferase [Clostridiales bacterium]
MISLEGVKKSEYSTIDEIRKRAFSLYEGVLPNYNVNKSKGLNELQVKYGSLLSVYKIALNGAIIGGVYLVQQSEFSWEVYKIFILPEKQGFGYGKQALLAVEKELSLAKELVLSTPNVFKEKIEFYKSCGYEVTGSEVNASGIELVTFSKKLNKVAITGLRPSAGGLHFGHYTGNVFPLIKYQNDYSCKLIFADLQLLNSKEYSRQETIDNCKLMIKQMMVLGVDFNKVEILLESDFKYDNLTDFMLLADKCSLSRILRMPLFKQYKKQNLPIKTSFLLYPVLQAMDVHLTNASIVFSNYDNKACVEFIEEILRKIDCNWNVKLLTGKVPFLVGTDGRKMSKSANNCFLFADDMQSVLKKITKMKTDSSRENASAVGTVENSTVFNYLKVFATDVEYQKLCDEYSKGEISDEKTKQILFERVSCFLNDYNARFNKITDSEVNEICLKYSIV